MAATFGGSRPVRNARGSFAAPRRCTEQPLAQPPGLQAEATFDLFRLERFGRSAPNPYSMTWQAVQHCPGIQINANSTGANSTPNQNPSRERRLHCGLEEVVSADFIGKLCSTGQVSKYRKGKAISWFEIACVRPLRKHVHHASKSRCSRCYREVYHTPAQG